MGRKVCALEGCAKPLPKGRAKWHSDECAALGTQRLKNERARVMAGEPLASQVRRPPQEFFDEGWDLMEPTSLVTKDCVDRFQVDKSTATRWYAYVRQESARARAREGWKPPPRAFPEKWRDLTVEYVTAMIADFRWFRNTFFLTEDEEPYLIAPFHERWIEALITMFATRGRLMILSPPRHGKTELLAHLVIWLICRFPNIRIIWVGPNDDVAEIVGQEVLDHLEANQPLIDAFCPPGVTFKPKGKGRSWTKSELTVDTRTVFGIKSPTAKFQGRGGTLVSRDADAIICDDIEQDKRVNQPAQRLSTRNWASTSLFSRKTKRTSIGFIGSRQHPDDLWQHFLDNDQFRSIVEFAHDPECEIPQNDPSRYAEHVDCMLWPELNDFEWLKGIEHDNELLGGRDTFEMVYLNRVTGLGMVVFEAAQVAACRDDHYQVGQIPTPWAPPGTPEEQVGGIRLVAGLDPSGVGYQAAFLWAFQVRPQLRMWMVDIENHEGGGIAQARKTIEAWHEKHGVAHWVVEENLYQGGIMKDEAIIALRQRLSIHMEPHHTGENKWDPYLGVSTLKPLFVNRSIVLPYGDLDSIAKSDAYQRQLVNFSNAPRNRNTHGGYKTDIVMASWFPMTVIRRARSEHKADIGVDYKPSFAGFSGSNWNTVPWQQRRSA